MIFKRSNQPSALQQAGETLGLSSGPGKDGGIQGEVDGVPVVVTRPIVQSTTGAGGLWVLAGPTAHNWIANIVPDVDTRPVERIDTAEYAGDAASWLGVDVTTKKASGDLSADDVTAIVRDVAARYAALG